MRAGSAIVAQLLAAATTPHGTEQPMQQTRRPVPAGGLYQALQQTQQHTESNAMLQSQQMHRLTSPQHQAPAQQWQQQQQQQQQSRDVQQLHSSHTICSGTPTSMVAAERIPEGPMRPRAHNGCFRQRQPGAHKRALADVLAREHEHNPEFAQELASMMEGLNERHAAHKRARELHAHQAHTGKIQLPPRGVNMLPANPCVPVCSGRRALHSGGAYAAAQCTMPEQPAAATPLASPQPASAAQAGSAGQPSVAARICEPWFLQQLRVRLARELDAVKASPGSVRGDQTVTDIVARAVADLRTAAGAGAATHTAYQARD